MKTEFEKMIAGEAYRPEDPALTAQREKVRRLLNRYNSRLDGGASPEQRELLAGILGTEVREDVFIQAPFYCDYGINIKTGKNFMSNFNCVILDCAEVVFGDNVMLAPNVQIYAAYHPTDPILRYSGQEFAGPVRIGHNVWIGGGSIVLPNVTIGDNSIIGAGSLVAKDIPANVIAVGNPCRVLRELEPEEYGKRMFL